jgi:sulfatase modifying factor 1
MKTRQNFSQAGAALFLILTGLAAQAEIPATMEYRGRLANAQGVGLNATVNIEVRLFRQSNGGNAVWNEVVGPVVVEDGVYSFSFGSAGSGLASSLNEHYGPEHLEIVVDGIAQSPRTKLLSVPYALKAGRVAWNYTYLSIMEKYRKLKVPDNLWFGNVPTGQEVMARLKIRNAGFGTVQISSVQYPDGFSGGNYSGVLAAGGEVELEVTFAPSDARLFRGAIRIFSDVGGQPLEVVATGKGYQINGLYGMVTVPSGMMSNQSPSGISPIYTSVAVVSGTRTHNYNCQGCAVYHPPSTYGGTSNLISVPTFSIGQYEVTWDEWRAVQQYGASRGYDLVSARLNLGTHPVDSVTWFDAVKWCNAYSEQEGLVPVYRTVGGQIYRSGRDPWVTVLESANGFRLPTGLEWEWAARGATRSLGYDYSGGNNLALVGRFYGNSGNAPFDMLYGSGYGTWPVGGLAANELGIHDMSGNVLEWCWDSPYWMESVEVNGVWTIVQARMRRGGSWLRDATQALVARPENPYTSEDYYYVDQGFRLARSFVEQPPPDGMTFVQGGTLPAQSALGAVAVSGFYLSHFEFTWEELESVVKFAGVLGYDDPNNWNDVNDGFQERDRPFANSWMPQAFKWCNLLSEVEGLTPVYRQISSRLVIRSGWVDFQDVMADPSANGYRLPTEAEWEWAARGGASSQGFVYSGSNSLDDVGWYGGNFGGNLRIGRKIPNELQLYDMSGGVWEMCWAGNGNMPVLRGGDVASPAVDCEVGSRTPTWIGPGLIGFRLARNNFN